MPVRCTHSEAIDINRYMRSKLIKQLWANDNIKVANKNVRIYEDPIHIMHSPSSSLSND